MKSDNNSGDNFYPNMEVEAHEINEIWKVNLKISPFMPNPSNVRNAFHKEINSLKETIKKQDESLATMNKSLECLLRKSR